jgi:hypothetical protein
VQASSSQDPVWQQWSQDDGHSWSAASLVPGLRDISPNLAVVSDGQGALFMVGIQATQAQSASLFYLRWDGQEWVDRQNLPLGYTADAASGASAILLPSHRLGVFYRVTTSSSPGTGPYIVGYTDRAVPAADLPVLPTLAPTPAPTATPSPSQESSLTPIPTLDSSGQQLTSDLPDGKWKPIIATLLVMLVIVCLAFWKLTARAR